MGCREEEDQDGGCRDIHTDGYQEERYSKLPSHEIPAEFQSWDGKEGFDSGFLQERCETRLTNNNEEEKFWMFEGKEMNLTRFLRYHPGGTYPLKSMRGNDVEPAMRSSHHSTEAYHFLRHFSTEERDLVDWTKPMLAQVGSLGPLYETWVWNPVDKPLRLFSSDILEKLTRTNVHQVVGTWVPVIITSLVFAFVSSPPIYSVGFRIFWMTALLLCGMAVWPLLEYSIHRWVFHLQPPSSSSVLITLHFGLHGLHHKVPFDEGRLLFPPGPCSVMAAAVYYIYTSLYTWWIAVTLFAGTILGYLLYDLIHYYLHHGNPKDGTYLYRMKRYHNQHHFSQQDLGFGISSDFWDQIFNTFIKLKKLSKPLSWDD